MKLINTRPGEDGENLAQKLRALGHQPLLAPLLEIKGRAAVFLPSSNYQALCFTSANGARFAPLGLPRDLAVFTVGAQSAKAAKDAGFLNVRAEGGDVHGLTHFLIGHLRCDNGPILYISGQETSGDLQGQLQLNGFVCDRVIAYDAVPLSLTLSATDLAKQNGVLLYSPRLAKIWVAEILRLGLQTQAARLTHYCLSAAIAKSLPHAWAVKIAQNPNEDAIFALLEKTS